MRYPSLRIDHCLNWQPAVRHFCLQSKRVTGATKALLSKGHGITLKLGLCLYNGVAVAQFLYALPLQLTGS